MGKYMKQILLEVQ